MAEDSTDKVAALIRRAEVYAKEHEVGPGLLAVWLVENGYAKMKRGRGYGQVSGDDLAEALLATFVITLRPHTGRPS